MAYFAKYLPLKKEECKENLKSDVIEDPIRVYYETDNSNSKIDKSEINDESDLTTMNSQKNIENESMKGTIWVKSEFKCSHCDKHFSSHDLKKHMETAHSNIPCDKCNEKFENLMLFYEHKYAKHR